MIKTKPLAFFTRLRSALRRRKPSADDNIERHEPDRFLGVFQDFLFGIVITSFLMLVSYTFMTGTVEDWIAHFIAAQDNAFTFDERLAAFTASVIALVNLVIIFGVALARTPDNEEVIDAIGDQSDELNERFAELENELHTGYESLRAMIDDLTPGIVPDEIPNLAERIGP